jgi:hypothetical protein
MIAIFTFRFLELENIVRDEWDAFCFQCSPITFFCFRSQGSSGLSLIAFVKYLARLNKNHLIPFTERIFQIFDKNRDGVLDFNEIVCGLSMIRKARGDKATHLCFRVSSYCLSIKIFCYHFSNSLFFVFYFAYFFHSDHFYPAVLECILSF